MSEINQTSSPTPQQLEARERMKALLGVTDEELDARILKIAEAIKIAQPNAILRNSLTTFKQVLTTPPRKYYHIVDGLFETVVDERDASSEKEAVAFAYSYSKQPWYFVPLKPNEMVNTMPKHEVWDHNKFVDWLRR